LRFGRRLAGGGVEIRSAKLLMKTTAVFSGDLKAKRIFERPDAVISAT
jgi:hypothetical protein